MNTQFSKYLPSKNFQKAIFAIVLALVILFLVSKIPSIIKKQETKKEPFAVLEVGELVEQDTDGDGLKDWEEGLWGMDPENADTDGNGINDGTEVLNIKNSIDGGDVFVAGGTDSLSQTETFSQQLFSLISALQENGELTDQSEASIAAEVSAFIKSRPEGTVYYKTDLKTVADTSANAVVYIQAINNAFTKYPIKVEDFALLQGVVTTPNTKSVNLEIKFVADKYKSLANTLLATPVVLGEVDVHLNLLNSIVTMSEILNDISLYAVDPVPALASLYQAGDILEEMSKNLEILNQDIINATSGSINI
ncbi:MAG: hypothetical protein KBD26_02145 [Candidatus Pacebacteria bacterium]|nr:hypothetical protein [Candidatus Paceibacterota bacterium]MBP9772613.1 hypothetical protein [Candidatus Paceibacterota bacterium]